MATQEHPQKFNFVFSDLDLIGYSGKYNAALRYCLNKSQQELDLGGVERSSDEDFLRCASIEFWMQVRQTFLELGGCYRKSKSQHCSCGDREHPCVEHPEGRGII